MRLLSRWRFSISGSRGRAHHSHMAPASLIALSLALLAPPALTPRAAMSAARAGARSAGRSRSPLLLADDTPPPSLLSRLLRWLPSPGAAAPSRPLPGGASASKLQVVAGDGVRGVPERDVIYEYFNFSASPFYAALDDAPPPASSTTGGVRWLRLGDEAAPTGMEAEFRAVFDAGRREVLQQIYDEALKEDKKGRRR